MLIPLELCAACLIKYAISLFSINIVDNAQVGLLISGNDEQIAFAWRMYRSRDKMVHKKDASLDIPNLCTVFDPEVMPKGGSEHTTLASEFRAIFSQEVNVHFLGLWYECL